MKCPGSFWVLVWSKVTLTSDKLQIWELSTQLLSVKLSFARLVRNVIFKSEYQSDHFFSFMDWKCQFIFIEKYINLDSLYLYFIIILVEMWNIFIYSPELSLMIKLVNVTFNWNWAVMLHQYSYIKNSWKHQQNSHSTYLHSTIWTP